MLVAIVRPVVRLIRGGDVSPPSCGDPGVDPAGAPAGGSSSGRGCGRRNRQLRRRWLWRRPWHPGQLQRHALSRTARPGRWTAGRCWASRSPPVLGSRSMICSPPVCHVRTIYLPSAGMLAEHGFELLPTAQRPHFTLRLHRADESELVAACSNALATPQPDPRTWKYGLIERRAAVYQVDITADLNDEDETGYVWTFLDEARDPGRITPGSSRRGGDQESRRVCQVVDLAPAGDGTIVHLRLLPASSTNTAPWSSEHSPAEPGHLCRSKIRILALTWVFSILRRRTRVRRSGRSGPVFGGSATCRGLLR